MRKYCIFFQPKNTPPSTFSVWSPGELEYFYKIAFESEPITIPPKSSNPYASELGSCLEQFDPARLEVFLSPAPIPEKIDPHYKNTIRFTHTPVKPDAIISSSVSPYIPVKPKSPVEKTPQQKRVEELVEFTSQAINIANAKGILDSDYRRMRDNLIDVALHDGNAIIRKGAVAGIVKIASREIDPEITKVLSRIVRQVVKTGSSEAFVIQPEQALALRTLFRLNTPDANRMLCQLLEVNGLDPRIKKIILSTLRSNNFFRHKTSEFVDSLIKTESRTIRWDDFTPISAVASLPSRQLREQIILSIDATFSRLAQTPEGVVQIRRQAPDIPKEVMLQIVEISQSQNIPLATFNKLFSAVHSSHMREELTHILTSFLLNQEWYSFRGISKIDRAGFLLRAILAEPINSDNLPLIVSAIRKSSFIVNQTANSLEKYSLVVQNLYEPSLKGSSLKSIKALMQRIRSRNSAPVEKAHNDITQLKTNSQPKALRVIESALTEEIVKSFSEIFPSPQAIDPNRIKQLMDVWYDVDPIFLYAFKLHQGDHKKTLVLVGEMVAHMDPPHLEAWKKWRYDLENTIVQSQIGFLPEEAQSAYARDYLVDLADVFVGENYRDKPMNVRKLLYHAFVGHHPTDTTESSANALLYSFFQGVTPDHENFSQLAHEKIEEFQKEKTLLQWVLALRGDYAVGKRAAESLGKWRKTELEKKERRKIIGFDHLITASEVQAEIARLRSTLSTNQESIIDQLAKSGTLNEYQKLVGRVEYLQTKNQSLQPAELARLEEIKVELSKQVGSDWESAIATCRKITNLSTTSPKDIDAKLMSFLEKYSLDPLVAGEAEVATVLDQKLLPELTSLEDSEDYNKLCQKLHLGDKPPEHILQKAISEYDLAANIELGP